jgi:hypothetical protein
LHAIHHENPDARDLENILHYKRACQQIGQ